MKILSEGGVFRKFDGVIQSERSDMVELFFENGGWLELTSDHQIFCEDGVKPAIEVKMGDKVKTIDSYQIVIYKSKHNRPTKVYDAINVEETHNFYAFDFLVKNCLYLDEFAFVQNDIQFYTSAYPVISSGNTTKIIITSTPNGMNLFYKLFTDAVNHRNSFAYKLFTWRDHPKKDEKWKIETIKNTSPKQFAQEHECRFLGSSNTLISGDCLERMVHADPIEQTESARLYKRVKPEAEYVACVDVSEGVGRDFSTVSVFDISVKPYEQVYVYQRNDISPWLLCGVVHEIARKYNSAYLVIENNSIGKIVADGVFYEYEYDNMVTTRMHKGSEKIEGYTLTDVGLVMNRKTKSIGCSAIKTLLEEGLLVVNDWATIQELGTFVKTGTSYQAEKNKFDDLVMPLIHFGWLTTQTWFEDLTSMGMRDLVKARNEKEAESRHLAFGFFSDGTDEISVTMM